MHTARKIGPTRRGPTSAGQAKLHRARGRPFVGVCTEQAGKPLENARPTSNLGASGTKKIRHSKSPKEGAQRSMEGGDDRWRGSPRVSHQEGSFETGRRPWSVTPWAQPRTGGWLQAPWDWGQSGKAWRCGEAGPTSVKPRGATGDPWEPLPGAPNS